MHSDGSEAPRTSSKFNFSNSDITIESSDNVRFRLHRKNLETHTEAFPASELGFDHSKGDIVKLTETAEILEILFQFVYPMRPPVLSAVDAETLVRLAEAVQKYQVFSAMYMCESLLRKHVESHSMSILAHTLKHYGCYEGTGLVNECAGLLVRKRQTLALVRRFAEDGLNTIYIVRWVEYETMWENVFRKLKDEIHGKSSYVQCHSNGHLCSNCRNCLLCWTDSLRDIDSIPALKEALANPMFLAQHYNSSQLHCQSCKPNECMYLAQFAKICSGLVESMPDFTSLVDQTRQHSENSN